MSTRELQLSTDYRKCSKDSETTEDISGLEFLYAVAFKEKAVPWNSALQYNLNSRDLIQPRNSEAGLWGVISIIKGHGKGGNDWISGGFTGSKTRMNTHTHTHTQGFQTQGTHITHPLPRGALCSPGTLSESSSPNVAPQTCTFRPASQRKSFSCVTYSHHDIVSFARGLNNMIGSSLSIISSFTFSIQAQPFIWSSFNLFWHY